MLYSCIDFSAKLPYHYGKTLHPEAGATRAGAGAGSWRKPLWFPIIPQWDVQFFMNNQEEKMLEVTGSAVENLKNYLAQNNIDSAVRIALMQGG